MLRQKNGFLIKNVYIIKPLISAIHKYEMFSYKKRVFNKTSVFSNSQVCKQRRKKQ